MDLQGKTALIFGATGVLGGEIATRLAEAGAELTLSGRQQDRLDTLSVPSARRLAADIRDEAAVREVVAEASVGRPIDVVVNAAGVVAFGSVDQLESDTLEELFLTNTFGAVFVSKAALANMSEGGVIASISGVIAEKNMPGMAAYGASKAALQSFNEGFAREARRAKVRVLDARPPHTETGLATRPVAGQAPKFPEGLPPGKVADIIVAALGDPSVSDLPSTAFA